MAMIPPSPAPAPEPQQQLPNTSARQGFDPATGKPLPSSADAPQSEYSDDIQRKIDIAKGKGLRRERPNVEGESGEHLTLRGKDGVPIECKYCGVNPCHGLSWIFEGQVRFKCDACGRAQRLGITAEEAEKQRTLLEGMDRAEENRNRAWREDDVRREEERQRQFDNYAQDPGQHDSALRNRNFVEGTFFS